MAGQAGGVKWECSECGFVAEDWEPPDSCPRCGAKRHAFVPVEED